MNLYQRYQEKLVYLSLPYIHGSEVKRKNIAFEQNKNSIILVDYDDSEIIYGQSLNSVEVNFRGVKNPHIYKEIKSEIKSRIRNIDTTVFPLIGLYRIAIGLIIIIALLYFEGTIL